jgi:fucose permease
MLLCTLLGCIFSVLLLTILAELHIKINALLWIFTPLIGLFMAPVFATAFSIPTELKARVNSFAASAFIIASGTGDMLLPVVVGWFLNPKLVGEAALLLVVLAVFIMCFFIYIITYVYGAASMDNRIDSTELQGLTEFAESWE